MSDYLQYWKFPYNPGPLNRLNHTAGDQLGRLRPGDVVWPVTIKDDRRLYLLGPILVGRVVSEREARRILGTSDLWAADYHVIARKGTVASVREINVHPIVPKLRFDGVVDRLPRQYSGRHLQSIRRLTRESAMLVSRIWTSKRAQSLSDSARPMRLAPVERLLYVVFAKANHVAERLKDAGQRAWTAPKLAGPGDIALFYFGGVHRRIYAIGRTATRAEPGVPDCSWTDSQHGFFARHKNITVLDPPLHLDEIRQTFPKWKRWANLYGVRVHIVPPLYQQWLAGLIAARNPATRELLAPWVARDLRRSDSARKPRGGIVRRAGHTVVTEEEEVRVVSRVGAGFGSPAENRRVERLAIRAAQRSLERRGWRVKSVERQKLGYDLDCVRNKTHIRVEVKGVRGVGNTFILTAGEYRRLATDPTFRLCVVENALAAAKVNLLDGKALRKRLTVEPLAYKASLVTRHTPHHSMQPARLARG
jgi:hypothetical protein